MKFAFKIFLFCFVVGSTLLAVNNCMADQTLFAHCFNKFQEEEICPEDKCNMACIEDKEEDRCKDVCLPKNCTEIPADKCPSEYCSLLRDCTGDNICYFRSYGENPVCGDIAYSGQAVACCEGLVRRCGVQFFEGHCDMEGKNSVYNLPICIPCGNGICEQFEDRCNCPEDCEGEKYTGKTFEDLVYPDPNTLSKKVKIDKSKKEQQKPKVIKRKKSKKSFFERR